MSAIGNAPTVQRRARSTTHTACLDGEVLIWDDAAQELHRLNRSASRIWMALTDWQTVEGVTRVVAVGVEPERIERDVVRCIAQLEESGLIELRAGG